MGFPGGRFDKAEIIGYTYIVYLSGCRKTPQKTDATEQRGVCAGGKKPTARSIKQDFETFLKVSKSAQRGEKTFSTR